MKLSTIFLCLIFSIAAFAGNSDNATTPVSDQVAVALEGYENGLNHSNQGLVESTILNVLKYKCRYPQVDMSSLHKSLQRLSEKGKTQDIREKAALVHKLLQNPQLIPSCSKELYADPVRFFEILSIGAKLAQVDLQETTPVVAAVCKTP